MLPDYEIREKSFQKTRGRYLLIKRCPEKEGIF